MVKRCSWGTCNSDDRYAGEQHMQGVTFWPIPNPKTRLSETRQWVKACGRKDFTIDNVDKHYYICRKHFVNGRPTEDYPHPTLATGNGKSAKKGRKQPVRKTLFEYKRARRSKIVVSQSGQCKVRAVSVSDEDIPTPTNFVEVRTEPDIIKPESMFSPEDAFLVPDDDLSNYAYAKSTNLFHVPVRKATVSVQTDLCFDDMSAYTDSEIMETGEMKRKLIMNDVFKSHKSCKFYTGLSIAMFSWLYSFLNMKAKCMVYWNSSDTLERENSETPKRGQGRTLSIKEELVLTLIRLRAHDIGRQLLESCVFAA